MSSDKSGDCVFCTLIADSDDERNLILHRGKHCFVIVNRYPYSSGHVMVVCHRHVASFTELSEDEAAEMMRLMARCEHALKNCYAPDGINAGANLGNSAGAGILGHLHMHLVPRWQGDTNFMTAVGETRVISEDLADTFQRLRNCFGD